MAAMTNRRQREWDSDRQPPPPIRLAPTPTNPTPALRIRRSRSGYQPARPGRNPHHALRSDGSRTGYSATWSPVAPCPTCHRADDPTLDPWEADDEDFQALNEIRIVEPCVSDRYNTHRPQHIDTPSSSRSRGTQTGDFGPPPLSSSSNLERRDPAYDDFRSQDRPQSTVAETNSQTDWIQVVDGAYRVVTPLALAAAMVVLYRGYVGKG